VPNSKQLAVTKMTYDTYLDTFIYYTTKVFMYKETSIQQTVSIAIVISWRRKCKQFHRSEWFRISLMRNSLFYYLPPQ